MDTDLLFWIAARASGVAAYVALCLSLVTGMAMRTGVLLWLTHNRAVRALHDFTGWLWLPLGLAHVVGLLLDRTARIGLADLVIPFAVPYGAVAIGFGTISLQLLAFVMITTAFRDKLAHGEWLVVHRLSYPAFALLFAHSILSGTDFGAPLIGGLAWLTALALAAVAAVRVTRAAAA